jgi:hypothetical protein
MNTKGQVSVSAVMSKSQVMSAFRELTVNSEEFDHRIWSVWDAEILERVARMIRDGYSPIANDLKNGF